MGNKKRRTDLIKNDGVKQKINDAPECQTLTWEPGRHMQSSKMQKTRKLEMTQSFTVYTDTHRHTHISMETDERIAGLQKEMIDKACARNWMVSKKQIYGIRTNPGGFEGSK